MVRLPKLRSYNIVAAGPSSAAQTDGGKRFPARGDDINLHTHSTLSSRQGARIREKERSGLVESNRPRIFSLSSYVETTPMPHQFLYPREKSVNAVDAREILGCQDTQADVAWIATFG
jgi:hypothetical protein